MKAVQTVDIKKHAASHQHDLQLMNAGDKRNYELFNKAKPSKGPCKMKVIVETMQ